MEPDKAGTMPFGRRTFLKTALVGAAAASLIGMNASRLASAQNNRYSFLYDSEACIGCNLCHFACKNKHDFPTGKVDPELSATNWLYVSKAQSGMNPEYHSVRQSCMHCENAMCQVVCPVEAIKKWKGLVYIDQDRCMGCGYCVNACPYGRPFKNEGPTIGDDAPHGVSRKCDGCYERVQEGELPACANACPADALKFGSRDEILARAQKSVSENANRWVYGMKELGGLGVLYVFPKTYDPTAEGVFPEVPTDTYLPAVSKGPLLLIGAGIGGVATFGALRMKRAKEVEDSELESESKPETDIDL